MTISAAMLAKARAQVLDTLTDAVTIQRPNRVSDGAGGMNTTWATVETTVGRFDPLSRVVQVEQAGRAEALRVEWQVTLPHDANIEVGYRVVKNGVAYEVRQAHFEHSSNVSKRCGVAVVK